MRRAIGRGLSQLIGESNERLASIPPGVQITEIPVDQIVPNSRQPRRAFDPETLEDLANSIRTHGLLQPLVVRRSGKDAYELIAGERRLRASKLAGRKTVPAIVRDASHEASLELALIENIQREDINAVDCAIAYRQLTDEFNLTQEEVASRVGKSRVAITNTLRLLKLPDRIQSGISEGMISEAHARALLGFESDAHRLAVYDQILDKGLTVKDVEEKAKSTGSRRERARKEKLQPEMDPNLSAVEEGLAVMLGTSVKIKPSPIGGEVTFQYYSNDDLDRILEILGLRL
ncbi:MAG TPA: ParB/RepB/Spo0J family partition protein [Fimbriimonadaceae bacterium]|nr:ParB/RepB/Spo0J family partition protein [Fimbriimonadaceae bacterium]